MMRKNKIILTIIIIFIGIHVNAQNCDFKRDTIYYVRINGTLTNGRPVFTQFTIKDLDTLKYFIQNSKDDFLCNIYKSAVFVTEPYIGFRDKLKCLGESADEEFKNFNRNLICLNKKCKEVFTLQNSQYQALHFSIIRLIGEFWIIPSNIDEMNNISESIKIKSECYNSKFYFKFKKIAEIIILTKDERKSLVSITN